MFAAARQVTGWLNSLNISREERVALRKDIEVADGRVKGFEYPNKAFCNSDALDVDEIVFVS